MADYSLYQQHYNSVPMLSTVDWRVLRLLLLKETIFAVMKAISFSFFFFFWFFWISAELHNPLQRTID